MSEGMTNFAETLAQQSQELDPSTGIPLVLDDRGAPVVGFKLPCGCKQCVSYCGKCAPYDWAYDETIRRLNEAKAKAKDPEAAHSEADEALVYFLRAFGYSLIADAYDAVPKYS